MQSESKTMSIEDVKRDLPNVQINIKGKVYTGSINGRKMDYPTVYVQEINYHEEFSWTTVTRAVNEKSILIG